MALLSNELQEAGVDPNLYPATLDLYTCQSGHAAAIPRRPISTAPPGALRFRMSLRKSSMGVIFVVNRNRIRLRIEDDSAAPGRFKVCPPIPSNPPQWPEASHPVAHVGSSTPPQAATRTYYSWMSPP